MFGGSRFFNDPYYPDPYMGGDPHMGADARAPRRTNQAPSNVIIEEIHEEDENEEEEEERERVYRANQRRRPSQPIVEEPLDQDFRAPRGAPRSPLPHERRHQYQVAPIIHEPFFGAMSMFPLMPFSSMFGMRNFNDMSTLMSTGSNYCSYSSSVTTMGPDGHTYTSTSSSKRGPGGVVESHQTERDSRSGVDKMTLHRQLGEKSRTLTRTRDRSGREERLEDLHGIDQEHATNFDQEWIRAANGTGITGGRSHQVPAAIEYHPQHTTRQPTRHSTYEEPAHHHNNYHPSDNYRHHLNHHPSSSHHHHHSPNSPHHHHHSVDHPRYSHHYHPTTHHTHHHAQPNHTTAHSAVHSAHMAAHNQALNQAHNQYYIPDDANAYRQGSNRKRDRNM